MIIKQYILKHNYLLLCLFLLFCNNLVAQNSTRKSRILFLVDASSSMTRPWNPNNNRFDVATNIILQLVDSIYAINNEVEFAVRSYGTEHPAQEKNCTDTQLEVPFNIQNATQIKSRLKYVKPIGFSPIAYSLRQASDNELSNALQYDYSIIFITDGGESCGGDVCQTFKDYIKNKIKVTPYVIGLDKNEQIKKFYECMGMYVEVTTAPNIIKAVQMIVNANRPLLDKPKQLNIKTVYSNTPVIKDTLPVPVKPEPIKEIIQPRPQPGFFPILRIARYPSNIKERIIINAVYAISKKGGTVTLKFETEEEKITPPPPVPKIDRDNKNILALQPISFELPIVQKAKLKINAIPFAANQKVTLRFENEEPPAKIVPHDINVYPKLKLNTYIKNESTKLVFENNKFMLFNRNKASLKFEFEFPQDTFVYPKLKLIASNDAIKKTSLQKPSAFLQETSKATLKFTFESPRDTFVYPKLKLIASNVAIKKASLQKPLAFVQKTSKASLKFTFESPRDTFVYPKLKLIASNTAIKKASLQKPTAFVQKTSKATLKFTFEAPRDTFIMPKMKLAIRSIQNNKLAFAKPAKFISKKTKASLRFEEEPKKDSLRSFAIGKYPNRYSFAFRLPQPYIPKNRGKALLLFVVTEPLKKKDSIFVKPTSIPVGTEIEFTTETVNNEETVVQIYFKGPNRKAYLKAKPEIEIWDPETKKLVLSFRRDMNGIEPVPQKIPAGKYNIIVKGQNDLSSSNVLIVANKTNKVFIKVTDGTLSFAYMGNLSRPVSEYTAIVNRRFAAGATVLQKCTDRLFYEPGTYYIEVNTLPAYKQSLDLSFGAVHEIQIPEPGTLQITNTSAYGKIQLQCVSGDQFLTFLTMNIAGIAADQRINLLPGVYKAIIPANPGIPQAGTKVIDFRIFSNKETPVELE